MVVKPDEPGAIDAAIAVLKDIFRPASPTIERKLFKGRDRELTQLLSAIQEVGMHAVVYGERGVGKTSLAYMGRGAFAIVNPIALTVRLACSAEDDFQSVWKRLPSHVRQELDLAEESTREALKDVVERVEDLVVYDDGTPDTVTRALHLLGSKLPLLVIIDEFDRIDDPDVTLLFADLIKTMADNPVACTVVLVGVADDVDELVESHGSIDRSMRQVQMPRMTPGELSEVVVDGVSEFGYRTGIKLSLDPEVVSAIANMSQGFPYYTHLLAGAIVERAVREGLTQVTSRMVIEALLEALDTAAQSIRSAYADAVSSNQTAQFEDTLLGCAMARVDVAGFFRASDVVDPLQQVSGRKKQASHFDHHLKRFCERGILDVRGTTRYRYRFSDPLMRPFVLMTGIRTGRLQLPTSD